MCYRRPGVAFTLALGGGGGGGVNTTGDVYIEIHSLYKGTTIKPSWSLDTCGQALPALGSGRPG